MVSVSINLQTSINQSISSFHYTNSTNVSGQVSKLDLIITDGTIITMDPDGLSYTSIAVGGDLISDVTNRTLTEEIDDALIKKYI